MPKPRAVPNLIGGADVCEILGGVNASTVRYLVLKGEITPVATLRGGAHVYIEDQIREFAKTYVPNGGTRRPAKTPKAS